jgi:hypothetical protein
MNLFKNKVTKMPRSKAELDAQIEKLGIDVKRKFLSELSKGSLGRANVTAGINDMWVAARLNVLLLNPAYLIAVKESESVEHV